MKGEYLNELEEPELAPEPVVKGNIHEAVDTKLLSKALFHYMSLKLINSSINLHLLAEDPLASNRFTSWWKIY